MRAKTSINAGDVGVIGKGIQIRGNLTGLEDLTVLKE